MLNQIKVQMKYLVLISHQIKFLGVNFQIKYLKSFEMFAIPEFSVKYLENMKTFIFEMSQFSNYINTWIKIVLKSNKI